MGIVDQLTDRIVPALKRLSKKGPKKWQLVEGALWHREKARDVGASSR